ncbi:MAG: hypothetical protein JWM32_1588 [Verrucomicrobia bacterium]|nr:hypothetical protein [Verrucomicrobiota bacterium]
MALTFLLHAAGPFFHDHLPLVWALVLMQLQPLKDGFGTALVLIFMVGFFMGVLKIWAGAQAISKGDPEGKSGLVAGIIIAAAAWIMGILYTVFGMGDAVITPRF